MKTQGQYSLEKYVPLIDVIAFAEPIDGQWDELIFAVLGPRNSPFTDESVIIPKTSKAHKKAS